jgi:hypothetical protein
MKNLYIQECKVYSDALDVELPQMVEKMLINQRFDFTNVDNRDARLDEIVTWLKNELGGGF